MIKKNYVGIDGCRAGWFFVSIGPGDESEFGVFETIDKLLSAYIGAKWMLIDIPIGLPHNGMPTRDCDSKARMLLSPKRHHSIFSPPCREALSASNYTEACDINQKVIGRKVSQQAFHVSKKILEVDLLRQNNYRARGILRESHPEVCFYALAGFKPMEHYKKREAGLEERLDLLKQYFSRSSAIYKAALGRYLRKEVAKDDILDALVLAITASMLEEGERRLPETIKKDQLGLPMEIVYAVSDQPEQICEPPEQDVIIINDLESTGLNTGSSRHNTTGTYSIVEAGGRAYLQIDTGCSALDERNQSIRFGPKAIKRLKDIIENLYLNLE